MKRRDFLRTTLLASAGLAAPGVLAACARGADTETKASSLQALADARLRDGAKRGLSVFLAGEDYVPGTESYLAFGLVKDQVGPVMGSAAQVWMAPVSDPAQPVAPAGSSTAPWQAYSKPDAPPPAPQGINAITTRFDRAGVWTMLVEVESGGERLLGTAAVNVKEKSSTRLAGEKPVPSRTPTLEDHRGVEPICTRTPPCDMHAVTLADALDLGKAVAFIVATPRFCMSRTCGPNLEELIIVQKEVGERVTFVHAEVYRDDKEAPVKGDFSPTFAEWGFASEPWLFLIGADGVIWSRLEGPVTAPVIRSELDRLLG